MGDLSLEQIPIQTGLFGSAVVLDVHTVAAHSRILSDGSSVFVAEHLRWNRGRSGMAPRPPPRRLPITIAGQIDLFPGVASAVEAPPPEPQSVPRPQVDPAQLRLW